MRKYILFSFFCLIAYTINADDKVKLIKQFNFAVNSKNNLEGFSKSLNENNFQYHSLRIDVTEGMLTRCTDGNMEIEWETQKISENNKAGYWFTWIAAVEMTNERHKFDVFVNDKKQFEFISGNEENRVFKNNNGTKLEFTSIEFDQHGDAHGYMSIFIPSNMAKVNEPVKLKIVGEAEKSNSWIIIYKADDVITYLQNLVKYENWLNVEVSYKDAKSNLKFISAITNKDKQLNLKIGDNEYKLKLNSNGDHTEGNLSIPNNDISNLRFIVSDENEELIDLSDLKSERKYQKLQQKSLLLNELKIENGAAKIFCQRIYKPQTVNNLLKLSQSKLSDGFISLMNSSHQDIAWMDSPEKCIIERDTMLLTPLYEKAIAANSNYRFDIEDALMLKEFIQRHPDKKEGIRQLLKDGKISCGSSFIQPYEEMYSGESLVRQFYLGKKWLKEVFDYDAKVYWNVDVPGRVLQMPQILKKSGTDYMVISRFEKGIYNWYSPDGSYVTMFSPGHYGDAFMPLHKNVYDAANYLAETGIYWEKYFNEKSNTTSIPLLSDWDMSPAIDYSNVINNWESINEIEKDGNKISLNLPKFKIQTANEFFEGFTKNSRNIPKIMGERPQVWLYIHGPSHYEALKASREADILLPVAEKFAAINSLINNSFENYPSRILLNAWESKIYPDHGWGGKEGQQTDDLFHSKFIFAKSEAKNIIENELNSISTKINTDEEKGKPVIVFNSLNWERSDPVGFYFYPQNENTYSIILTDANNKSVQVQLSDISTNKNGSIKSAKVNFIAENVPSIGYKTFYLSESNNKISDEKFKPFESEQYNIVLSDKGIKSIYDKELKKELLDTSKFFGGEIFTLQSEGNGAGEFSDIQQPTLEGFDKTSNYKLNWEVIENGPVFSKFKFRQKIKNAVVEQNVTLYKKIKKIDIDIALLNWEGVLYREYRMAIPLNMENEQISYETAFGVVNVGKDEIEGYAGERYTTVCKNIHPRGIENWISANSLDFGMTLSSCVAVADYIDPINMSSKDLVLQPILLASRKSCHGEGNEYLQTGDHHYKFSLNSHVAGWQNGFRNGKGANENLMVVVYPNKSVTADLPEELSFFSSKNDNVIISTIKKSEDDRSIVLRAYDIFGTNSDIELRGFKDIQSANTANLIEENIKELKFSKNTLPISLGKNSIETIKLKFDMN